VAHLNIYLDLESLEIQRSGFNFKLNLTSVIGNLANCNIQRDMFPAIISWPMTISEVAAGKMIRFHFKLRQAICTLVSNDCVNQR
jgi:hypothetical protein